MRRVLERVRYALGWRWRHHVTVCCTHPPGCFFCSWCGFGSRR